MFSNWLHVADPGGSRRRDALRAVATTLTSWLVMRALLPILAGHSMPAVTLFAVTVSFITVLVVSDPRRRDRRVTLVMGGAVFALGVLLAAIFHGVGWVFPPLLLGLIYFAFAARRWGLRAGQLALLGVMGLYFAQGSGASWGNVRWYLLAVLIGVSSLWLWQFVLLPYDPVRSLRQTIRAFFAEVGGGVAGIADLIESPPSDTAYAVERLTKRLNDIKRTRSVIERQFPGVLAPGSWDKGDIGKLQVALYGAELGFGRLHEGARASVSERLPAGLSAELVQVLRSLQEALVAGDAAGLQALADQGALFQERIRDNAMVFGRGNRDSLPEADGGELLQRPPWIEGALKLAGGTWQIGRAMGQVHALNVKEAHGTPPEAGAPPAPVAGKANAGAPPLVPFLGKFKLHPTSMLGIQAVLATGLAMLVAGLLGLEHSNWVFWTALMVIAGSSGESLRRMLLRVVGTTAGVAIGVGLALAAPDNTLLVAAVVAACVYLTIFFEPVSYPLTVLWLNIGFVMTYTMLGANEFDLLYSRSITTLLGALVAAVTVVYIFPIRSMSRFKAAAIRYLDAVDVYVAAFVKALFDRGAEDALATAQANAASAFDAVEQTLPAVEYENNLLLQAESPLTTQAVRIAALAAEVEQLDIVGAQQDLTAAPNEHGRLLRLLAERIHSNVQRIIGVMRAQPGPAVSEDKSGFDSASADGVFLEEGLNREGLLKSPRAAALLRIQGIVSELAADVAVPDAGFTQGKPSRQVNRR